MPTDTGAASALQNVHLFSRTPLLDSSPAETRQALRTYFINTFDEYTRLFDALNCVDAFYIKPINLRHPLIFYFGHTATFFINKLLFSRLVESGIDEHRKFIFALGVDELSWVVLASIIYH